MRTHLHSPLKEIHQTKARRIGTPSLDRPLGRINTRLDKGGVSNGRVLGVSSNRRVLRLSSNGSVGDHRICSHLHVLDDMLYKCSAEGSLCGYCCICGCSGCLRGQVAQEKGGSPAISVRTFGPFISVHQNPPLSPSTNLPVPMRDKGSGVSTLPAWQRYLVVRRIEKKKQKDRIAIPCIAV
jgi:hypothetical protein